MLGKYHETKVVLFVQAVNKAGTDNIAEGALSCDVNLNKNTLCLSCKYRS